VPLLSGPVTDDGAVVELLIGVHQDRRETLERNGLPVPALIRVSAQIDPGSALSGVGVDIVRRLDIPFIDTILLRTPSTGEEPHRSER
jgi:hypothetical protein